MANPVLRSKLVIGLGAALALAVVAYLFYYLDNLPRSIPIKAGQNWTVGAGQALRLGGYAGGPLLNFEFADPAVVKLSFGAGATLQPDADTADIPATGGQPLLFDMANVERENASVAISGQAGADSTLVIEPVRPDPTYLTLRIHSEGAPLEVEFQTFPNPSAKQHGHVQLGQDVVLEQAKVTVPAGVVFTLGLPARMSNMRVDPGTADQNGNPRLALRGLEIGDIDGGAFLRRWAACGSPSGTVLWQRPVPNFGAADCRADRLWITSVVVDNDVKVGAAGSGFVLQDGTVETWPLFRAIIGNQLVRTAMGVLLAGLVSWAFIAIRGRSAADKKAP